MTTVGYFRPVVASPGSDDTTIDLINRRYGLNQTHEQSFGITTDQTREVGSLHDADGLISEIMGKFDSLLNWLRGKIHIFGQKYDPQDLVQKVTGSKIDAAAYVRYLTKKYSDIYGL